MTPALRLIPLFVLYLLIVAGLIYRGEYMDAALMAIPFIFGALALYSHFIEDEE